MDRLLGRRAGGERGGERPRDDAARLVEIARVGELADDRIREARASRGAPGPLDGETRLADSTDAGDRHEPGAGVEEAVERVALPRAPDEGAWYRNASRPHAEKIIVASGDARRARAKNKIR